jgi:hypothetical protein
MPTPRHQQAADPITAIYDREITDHYSAEEWQAILDATAVWEAKRAKADAAKALLAQHDIPFTPVSSKKT